MITSIGHDKPPHPPPKPPEDCTAAKWPLGLSRVEAASYIGVSPSLFDRLVEDGRMPKPIGINARKVWDRRRIEEAFTELAQDGSDHNPWDDDWVKRGGKGEH